MFAKLQITCPLCGETQPRFQMVEHNIREIRLGNAVKFVGSEKNVGQTLKFQRQVLTDHLPNCTAPRNQTLINLYVGE